MMLHSSRETSQISKLMWPETMKCKLKQRWTNWSTKSNSVSSMPKVLRKIMTKEWHSKMTVLRSQTVKIWVFVKGNSKNIESKPNLENIQLQSVTTNQIYSCTAILSHMSVSSNLTTQLTTGAADTQLCMFDADTPEGKTENGTGLTDIRKDNESANNACIKHTHASLLNWRQNHFGSSVEDKLTQGLQNHAQMPSICSTITRNVHPCSQVLWGCAWQQTERLGMLSTVLH